MSLGNMLKVGDFAFVKDDVLSKHNLCKGDVVYLAGDMIVPHDKEDPYSLRRLFVAAKVEYNHVNVNGGGFTVDGLRLTYVGDKEQEFLDKIREGDFKKNETSN